MNQFPPRWRPDAEVAFALLAKGQQGAPAGSETVIINNAPVTIIPVAPKREEFVLWVSKDGVDDDAADRGAYEKPFKTLRAAIAFFSHPRTRTMFQQVKVIKMRGPGDFSGDGLTPFFTGKWVVEAGAGVTLPPLEFDTRDSLTFGSGQLCSLELRAVGMDVLLDYDSAPHIAPDDKGVSLYLSTAAGDAVSGLTCSIAGFVMGEIDGKAGLPIGLTTRDVEGSAITGDTITLNSLRDSWSAELDINTLFRAVETLFTSDVAVTHGMADRALEGLQGCYFGAAHNVTGPLGGNIFMDALSNARFKNKGWAVVTATKVVVNDTVA